MSESQRDALAILAEVWALAPDVRLGQLMAHLGFLGEVHLGKGLGSIDDDELMAVLCRHRAELQARQAGVSLPPSLADSSATSVAGSPMSPTVAK